MLAIIVSMVMMALDSSASDGQYSPKGNPVIREMAVAITWLFTIEAVMKILADGLVTESAESAHSHYSLAGVCRSLLRRYRYSSFNILAVQFWLCFVLYVEVV